MDVLFIILATFPIIIMLAACTFSGMLIRHRVYGA